jgi:uncharacterized membrane protein
MLFTGLVAWCFARTLREGEVPLITRIVAAIERRPPGQLEPAILDYTRRLTAAWAALLAALALTNAVLALLAVPDGVLARLGHTPAWAIERAQWSWFANLIDYALIGLFFCAEFWWRQRRFPGRFRSFGEFLRRMGGLGPAFWRDVLR